MSIDYSNKRNNENKSVERVKKKSEKEPLCFGLENNCKVINIV